MFYFDFSDPKCGLRRLTYVVNAKPCFATHRAIEESDGGTGALPPSPIASMRPSWLAISDEQAMWRVQTQDDETAFAELVGRWETPIQRLCARMTGDVHCGEDLAQETFTRVFALRKQYQPAGKFSTWLWRIALNLSYDELRRRRRRDEWSPKGLGAENACVLETSIAPEAAPDNALLQQERGELVRCALSRLSDAYRSVLVLRHYENLKFREIAEVLDLPEGTVKSRMAEALTQMSRLLHAALESKPSKPQNTHDQLKENLIL